MITTTLKRHTDYNEIMIKHRESISALKLLFVGVTYSKTGANKFQLLLIELFWSIIVWSQNTVCPEAMKYDHTASISNWIIKFLLASTLAVLGFNLTFWSKVWARTLRSGNPSPVTHYFGRRRVPHCKWPTERFQRRKIAFILFVWQKHVVRKWLN